MKYLTNSICVVLACLLACVSSASEALRFSYWDDAKPPFIIQKGGVVVSGILKDLADSVSSSLSKPVEFVRLPVARIEQQLRAGLIDVDCLTSPIWKESPGSYNWSPVLLNGSDRFLVQPAFNNKLNSFADLKGARLGIYNGYVYHPEIMGMINSGDILTVKVKGVEHGIQLLELNRLDALIDFGPILKYQIREKGLSNRLALAELPADQYKLHCACSKKMKASTEQINSTFERLIKGGEIEKILNKYQ